MTRRFLVAALALLVTLADTPAFAAAPSAEEFVAAIYAAYKGKSDTAPGIKLTSRAAMLRYFEPSLANLMDKDARDAKRRQEVGKLGGDPFIDAQDWEIDAFDIAVKEDKTKATATVSFKNFGEAKTVVLDLVKLKAGWRIHDVKYSHGTLRGIFTGK